MKSNVPSSPQMPAGKRRQEFEFHRQRTCQSGVLGKCSLCDGLRDKYSRCQQVMMKGNRDVLIRCTFILRLGSSSTAYGACSRGS